MFKIIFAGMTIVCVAVPLSVAGSAFAEDGTELGALAGTYMQNAVCKGNGKDDVAMKVTISAQEIVSNIGVCKVLDTKQNKTSIFVHVECKFPAGPLIGDITFTPQPDKTIKFVDRDNTYNAVLHRCPD